MLEKQFTFSRMLGLLFYWMAEHGYDWSLGDAWRSGDKLQCCHCGREHSYQELLVYNKRSKAMNSKHLDRLAIDIILFEGGKPAPAEAYRPIAEKWESLGGVAGFRFGIKKEDYDTKAGWDAGHLEL